MCVKHLNMTYTDVWNMPTYERRFFIETFTKEMTKQREEMDKMKSSSARGTRTTKIMGPKT